MRFEMLSNNLIFLPRAKKSWPWCPLNSLQNMDALWAVMDNHF
jgi:hypothetical protein